MLIDPYRHGLFSGPADPFWSDTVLLLQVDGSTVYSRVGAPALSTTGGGGVSESPTLFSKSTFNNPGNTTQNTNYFRARYTGSEFVFDGAFTIEGWFYFDVLNTSNNGLIATPHGASFSSRWLGMFAHQNGALILRIGTGSIVSSTGLLTTGQWYHLAVSRTSGGTIRLYINGTEVASGSNNTTFGYNDGTNTDMLVGSGFQLDDDHADLDGHWGEIRVTKNARYTSNFTAPSAPFPTHG